MHSSLDEKPLNGSDETRARIQPVRTVLNSVYDVIITAHQSSAISKGTCYADSIGQHSPLQPSAFIG